MSGQFNTEEELLAEEIVKWERSDSEKGQIYTRPEVVNFMLTAIGLNKNSHLDEVKILEPSCGEGEFAIEIIRRLISRKPSIEELQGKLLAIDLVEKSIDIAKAKTRTLLEKHEYSDSEINKLLNAWFKAGDFLLIDINAEFTHIVGNPPYVRVENIPKRLLAEYRKRYTTMSDRADLYIPFFERSLLLLKNKGTLSFICTDRWTKNIYGKSLRDLVSKNYSLDLYIDLYGIDAFEASVMTYPAITQISNQKADHTILLHDTSFCEIEAQNISKAILGEKTSLPIRKGIVNGTKPWLLGAADQISLIRMLEERFCTIEDAGCKVFIGAATGANKIYIVDKESVQVEPSRLLPVITASEIKSGKIKWKGKFIINTYDKKGAISLEHYPLLARYLTSHKHVLAARHIAINDKNRWYKTIDRVYEERCRQEKLLIPDISSEPVVVYDRGDFHPNNSIYYICSNSWNLQALKVILLSSITRLFISTYSTKVANGYLRFQAQHLRRIRLPKWEHLNEELKSAMIEAGTLNNTEQYDTLAGRAYELNEEEKAILGV